MHRTAMPQVPCVPHHWYCTQYSVWQRSELLSLAVIHCAQATPFSTSTNPNLCTNNALFHQHVRTAYHQYGSQQEVDSHENIDYHVV